MSLRDDLNVCAPRLRRFARALVGGHPAPNQIADDLVQEVLHRTFEAGAALCLAGSDLQLHLYTALTHSIRGRLASAAKAQGDHGEQENLCSGNPRAAGKLPLIASCRDKFAGALLDLSFEEREALLLVVLEGFSYAQAARILQVSRTVFIARLARARAALGDVPAANFIQHPEKPLPSYLRLVK